MLPSPTRVVTRTTINNVPWDGISTPPRGKDATPNSSQHAHLNFRVPQLLMYRINHWEIVYDGFDGLS